MRFIANQVAEAKRGYFFRQNVDKKSTERGDEKMNNQVDITTYNGSLVVSSRRVADNFGKQHKHVLEAIENIKAENSALRNGSPYAS